MGQDKPLAGILLIGFSMVALSGMDSVVKGLVGGDLPVVQILALRSLMIVPLFLVLTLRKRGLKGLGTHRPGLHLLRVAGGIGAPLLFFNSLRTLPLADATTIIFGATFITTGLSALVLKERVGRDRWTAVVIGFAGVVIAMRPTGAVLDSGALYAFGASLSYAVLVLTTRVLGQEEGTLRPVLYMHLAIGIAAGTALPFAYRPFTGAEIGLVGGVALLAVVGHVSLTRALHLAPVGLLAPIEYTALVWAATFGYAFWGDLPAPHTLAGASIIVASGLYLVYRERPSGRDAQAVVPGIDT